MKSGPGTRLPGKFPERDTGPAGPALADYPQPRNFEPAKYPENTAGHRFFRNTPLPVAAGDAEIPKHTHPGLQDGKSPFTKRPESLWPDEN
jgi:hypothetical protein